MKNKKRLCKIVSIVLSLVMMVSGMAEDSMMSATAAGGYGVAGPTTDSDGVVTWDCVYFGNYWQNDTDGNGTVDTSDEREPIKWRVLSVDGDDAFLLADKNLDCKRYNEANTSVTWETCTLRSWLNGYGAGSNKDGKDYSTDNFIDVAFSQAEQDAVKKASVINKDNPTYGTEGGNDTQDKIYLLSIAEVSKASYGFDATFSTESETRYSQNTEYAKAQGAYTVSGGGISGNGWWWLRSPGDDSNDASYVSYHGWGYDYGGYVDYFSNAVRPALHLNLSSDVWRNAGKVTSDGRNIGEENPDAGAYTALVGFQTSDYDFRELSSTNGLNKAKEASVKYNEWLKEQGKEVPPYNNVNIYLNGNGAAINSKTGNLSKPENVELYRGATVTDAKMSEDGEYTVGISGLNLIEDEDKDSNEIFNMLRIDTDIPMTEANQDVKLAVSSFRVNGEELLSGNVEVPYVVPYNPAITDRYEFMIADIYEGHGIATLYDVANALSVPDGNFNIEMKFAIEGADWASAPLPDATSTPEPFQPAQSAGPEVTPPPVVSIAPFDIYIASNVNSALTPDEGEVGSDGKAIQLAVFASRDIKAKIDAAQTKDKKPLFTTGTMLWRVTDSGVSSKTISQTGEYALSVTARGDSEDLTNDGAIWLPLLINGTDSNMPTDFNLVGKSITVGEGDVAKTYNWPTRLIQDGQGSVSLTVCNQWETDVDRKKISNAVKDIIPVKKGDKLTFNFYVTPESTKVPIKTLPLSEDDGYTAWMRYCDNEWGWANNSSLQENIGSTVKIVGDGTYTLTLSKDDFAELPDNPADGAMVWTIDMVDMANAQNFDTSNLSVRDVTIRVDGKKIRTDSSKMYFGDIEGNGNLRLELCNEWGYGGGDFKTRYVDENDNPIAAGFDLNKIQFEDSVSVTFTLEGIKEGFTPLGVWEDENEYPIVRTAKGLIEGDPEQSAVPEVSAAPSASTNPVASPSSSNSANPVATASIKPTATASPRPTATSRPRATASGEDGGIKAKLHGTDVEASSAYKKLGYKYKPVVELEWTWNSEADGYMVQRRAGQNGTYTTVKNIVNHEIITWKDSSVKKGVTYQYRVCAYGTDSDDERVIGDAGDTASITVSRKVMKPKITVKRRGRKMILTFKKAEGSGFYAQYRYVGDRKWTGMPNLRGKLKKNITKPLRARGFRLRVRTYTKVNGKRKYSGWSKPVLVK